MVSVVADHVLLMFDKRVVTWFSVWANMVNKLDLTGMIMSDQCGQTEMTAKHWAILTASYDNIFDIEVQHWSDLPMVR